MQRPSAPHFLRVVQALAFVSGVGPVALSASALAGCSSTGRVTTGDSPIFSGAQVMEDSGAPFYGTAPAPDDAGPPPGIDVPYDGGGMGTLDATFLDDATGIPTGIGPPPLYDGSVMGVIDAGIMAEDSSAPVPDAAGPIPVGGPLLPPELPSALRDGVV